MTDALPKPKRKYVRKAGKPIPKNLPGLRLAESLEADREAMERDLEARALNYLTHPDRKKPGPVYYSDEVAAEVLARLASGETLTKICKDEHMPSRRMIFSWVYRTTSKIEPFATEYVKARMEALYGIADEMRDIADDASNDWTVDANGNPIVDREHISRSKLRIDTRKWELSKLLASVFGDKVQHTGEDGGPMVVNIVRFTEEG